MSSITLKDVDKAVCLAFATTPEFLRGRKKARPFVVPRFAFYDLARTHTERSLPQIGQYLHRDHTTVLHGMCRSARLTAEDESYRAKLQAARDHLLTSAPYRRQIRVDMAPMLAGDLQATG